ncbi:MAG: C45 family peptidase [Polyangiaceae bacterium]
MEKHYLGESRSLTVAGDAYERARQQGVACAGEMDRAASSIGSIVVEPRRVGARAHEILSGVGLGVAGAYYLARHRRALVDHANGKYWKAHRGLAEGAGKPLPVMFGLGAVPEIVGAQLSFTMGCTAIAIAPSASATGAARIAYNHDFPPRFGRYNFARRNLPTDGYASICLAYPIMVGCLAGVNERGFAVTLNHAFSTDYEGRPGLLLTTLVQDALDRCATVADAIELFSRAPVTNGAILTIADATGERAAVELSCTASRVRRPTGPLLVSFNKYRHPEMERYEVPPGAVSTGLVPGIPLHESNIERARRWDELEASLPARFDDADIRAVMTDHRGGRGDSNSICRHDDPLSETLWSAILDTGSRSMRVVFGHACDGPYRTFEIDTPVPPRARTALDARAN